VLAQLKFIYTAGRDQHGRPIVVILAPRLPRDRRLDHDNVLLYFIHILHPIAEHGDYVVVYVHSKSIPEENKPQLSYIKRMYSVFPRSYKKNLKACYVVGSGFWLKMFLSLLKPVVSSKFWKKLKHLKHGTDIYAHISKEQLQIPEEMLIATKQKKIATVPVSRIFGVPLTDAIANRLPTATGVPLVVEHCLKYLEQHGLEAEGLFRISGTQVVVEGLKVDRVLMLGSSIKTMVVVEGVQPEV